MQPKPGERVGPYEIRGHVGTGGMGAVYRAYDARLQRDVALKFLHPSDEDGSSRARLLQEARAASALNHPNICTVFDVGEDAGRPYIALEYLEGEPLNRLLGAGGLPAEVVTRYGIQIADALAHAHSRGIIHRDLKPGNIVTSADGRLKVLDFGLARRDREAAFLTTRLETAEEPGSKWGGTLAYMAPEVLRGGRGDERSDLWALGVVLHQLASGELPFSGASGPQLVAAILDGSPAPLPASVPVSLRTTIARLLSRDPARRIHSAGEVRAVLEATETTASAGPGFVAAATPGGRRRRLWVALPVAACLALAGWLLSQSPRGFKRCSSASITCSRRSLEPTGRPRSPPTPTSWHSWRPTKPVFRSSG
jgi:eukaryotic-like serine/threonine-protein kinase